MTVHLLAWRKSCIKTRKEHKSEFVLNVPQNSEFHSSKWLTECLKSKVKVLNLKRLWRFTGNQGWNLGRFYLSILNFKSPSINLKIKYALPESWKDAKSPVWAPSSCWITILPFQAVCLSTKHAGAIQHLCCASLPQISAGVGACVLPQSRYKSIRGQCQSLQNFTQDRKSVV